MTFLETVGEDDAAGATAVIYQRDAAAMGFLPGYTRAFGARPEVYEAWRGLIRAVGGGMDPRRFELVTLAAARELRSTYCSIAHALVVLRKDLAPPADLARLADGDLGPLDDAERALVAFAAKAARSAAEVTEEDVESLRGHGLSDPEILDVVLTVAARAFFSTVLDATGTRTDAALAGRLDPAVAAALTVGRPPHEG